MTIVKNAESVKRARGRPRAFDRQHALETAARTFWRLGYEGASIADLTMALGITPQSLYAAFTSKADLYREALAWYRSDPGANTARTLAEEKDVIVALSRVLTDSAAAFSGDETPPGCMISTAILTCAEENQPIADHVAALRSGALKMFEQRIRGGIKEGQLAADTNIEGLARFIGAIVQGMSVQARDGAKTDELSAIADQAVEYLRTIAAKK
nr:TetR/AcrR family transcriptional regulator [Mesorhizobium zhangyense]